MFEKEMKKETIIVSDAVTSWGSDITTTEELKSVFIFLSCLSSWTFNDASDSVEISEIHRDSEDYQT